ncbi:hypothetical protein [Kitasatospora sp. MAP5-34]|uniref:hypothetical protein n=1 Tax=Kitasatospora sp. MAP5-34 TaxID=3035102 RepID=UPI0024765D6F|nr:hypothetical protein [Kitasatospora sp. MAP5-34]MDH6579122.1 hypothetical protein [Kitasatospora sp. MAP5-34]
MGRVPGRRQSQPAVAAARAAQRAWGRMSLWAPQKVDWSTAITASLCRHSPKRVPVIHSSHACLIYPSARAMKFHCHIAAHEDNGMMSYIDVVS